MKMNKKGFTLIELLAVIVILAIIALIATPIIMNVINKSQEGADARSVETYGKAVESAFYQFQIDNPTADAGTVSDIKTNLIGEAGALHADLVEYITLSGNGESVVCTDGSISGEDTEDKVELIRLEGCTVGGRTQKYNFTSAAGASKAK